MEEHIEIPGVDAHIIKGMLGKAEDSEKLIIFVHGLTGRMNEHHYLLAPKFFNPQGYSTFRFDFYSTKPGRRLMDSSISTHVEDLERVIAHFKEEYELYMIAHSIGCLVALKTDTSVAKKVVLWDPSVGFTKEKEQKADHDEERGYWIRHSGMDVLLSEKMIEEWRAATDISKNLEGIDTETAFIFAGLNTNKGPWLQFIEGHKHITIPGARHVFYEEGAREQLYLATLELLQD